MYVPPIAKVCTHAQDFPWRRVMHPPEPQHLIELSHCFKSAVAGVYSRMQHGRYPIPGQVCTNLGQLVMVLSLPCRLE